MHGGAGGRTLSAMMDNPAGGTGKSTRLISLDVFRGITIAGMILVNNPGDWSHKYAPLGHAEWNGWTPTDLVFPFFLFIVGVAITFAFENRLARGFSKLRLFEQVVRRSLILFLLGMILFGFADWRLIGPYILAIIGLALVFWDEPPLGLGHTGPERARKLLGWLILIGAVVYFAVDFEYFNTPHPPATPADSPIRVPGVLQRIALCYFVASIIVLLFGVTGRVFFTVLLIAGYWWIVAYVQPPDSYVSNLSPERVLGRLHDWLDVKLLGAHLYRERPDPEGILSTLPAIATTLIGVLVGNWLHSYREKRDHALGLFFFGNLLVAAGLWMNHAFPLNKKIWTSSYVLFTGGAAMEFLAMCYWLIDVRGKRAWAWPFFVFGTNAIAVFFASGIVGRILSRTKVWEGDRQISAAQWLYDELFQSWIRDPCQASLAWALCYVVLWFFLILPLYRRRIFIKV